MIDNIIHMNRSHVLNICFFLQGRLLLYKDKNDIKEPNNILVGNPGDDGARIDVDEKKDTNFNLILKSKTYEVGYLSCRIQITSFVYDCSIVQHTLLLVF